MKVNPKMKIHPELRAMGYAVKILNGTFTTGKLKLFHKMRRKKLNPPNLLSEGIRCDQVYIQRSNGTQMRTLIFQPTNLSSNNERGQDKKIPCILWFHGGGYAIGSPDQSVPYARHLIAVRPCMVVVPDYTLSPQAPYPAALEDAYTALQYIDHLAAQAQSPISKNAICVGGDSAGGGLCVALCMYTRHMNQSAPNPIHIALQMPLYPMLDDRMITRSSQNNQAPVWNSASSKNAWKLYLGPLWGTDPVPIFASPSRATDYTFLPPAVTIVGDLEPFRDETLAYVANLKNAGVAAQIQVFEGCYHAFDQMCPKAQVSKDALQFVMGVFSNFTFM